MGRLFDELKRRNVVRVAIAYLIFGWLVIQIGEALLPGFGAPDWVFKTMVLFLATGFPFALLFAWAFELTPDGIKKTRDVNLAASVTALWRCSSSMGSRLWSSISSIPSGPLLLGKARSLAAAREIRFRMTLFV